MTMQQGMPSVDPRPTGLPIGSYDTYLEAQRAVDYLSDEKFPVEHTTIVGNNLRQVEKITGRLTWGRAIAAGLASGAWFGLFVGDLLGIYATDGSDRVRPVARPPRFHLPDGGGRDHVRRAVRPQVRRGGSQPPRQAGAEGRGGTADAADPDPAAAGRRGPVALNPWRSQAGSVPRMTLSVECCGFPSYGSRETSTIR